MTVGSFLLGALSVAHFTFAMISTGSIGWLVGGWLILPLTAFVWPFVAWTTGWVPGGIALVYYVLLFVVGIMGEKEG